MAVTEREEKILP